MNAPTAPRAPAALHQPFDWLGPELQGHDTAAFLSLALDIGHGIETCLALVHSANMERTADDDADPGDEGTPILNSDDTERLLRLAQVSARLLSDDAQRRIERLSTGARP